MEDNNINKEVLNKEMVDEEMMDLNKIIDLINSNEVQQISDLFQPSNHGDSGKGTNGTEQNFGFNDFNFISSKHYPTREEFIDCVRHTASKLGYAIVIRKSKQSRYVMLSCDRGGEYRGNKTSVEKKNNLKRATGTRLINCPFEIWGKCKSDKCWEMEIKNLTHNHKPSDDMEGHPTHRRFSKDEYLRIQEMTVAVVAPRQILTSLRQSNSNLKFTSRSVYNARAKFRKESLQGRTVIQALFEELGQSEYIFDVKRDDDGHLTHLFMVHPHSISLTKLYPRVFLMDCTYKTNKYKMPLLNIVGVTSFNTTFFSGCVFMRKEETEDYVWALEKFSTILGFNVHPITIVTDREQALMNAIEIIFPSTVHLLCVWHIEKNVLAKCKKNFETTIAWEDFLSNWTNVIKSPDEVSFESVWEIFEDQYKEKESVISYIRNTWLPFKEKFICAWTNQILHFGNHVTSRVEGVHSKLKKHLQVSTGDIRGVKEKFCHVVVNEFQDIKSQLSSEKMRVPHKYRIPFFQELIGHVSAYALGELFKQYELNTPDNFSICRGHFTRSMGLPCVHRMREKSDQGLKLGDIHPHYRLDTICLTNIDDHEDEVDKLFKNVYDNYKKMSLSQKEDTCKKIATLFDVPIPLTLEPKVYPHKGRPTSSKKRKNENSTTRDPLLFEIVEKSQNSGIRKGSQNISSNFTSSFINLENHGKLFI